jgi:hypothetical protein
MPGDLRFQQVDATTTLNGYTIQPALTSDVACAPPGGGGYATSFGAATGTSFFLSNNPCLWQYSTFDLPSGVAGLEAGYAGVATQDFQGILSAPAAYFGFGNASDTGSVITSLSLVPAANTGALGLIHSDSSSGFTQTTYTVPASGLQALATQEGLNSRVITAISYDGSQATVLSYGWSNQPSAVYEAQVAFATLNTAAAQAQILASSGYIITATGSSQAADGSGVILIGTRVQGDTMPRPFLVGDVLAGTVDPLFEQGYAIVAVIEEYQNTALVLKSYIGER